MGGVCATRGAAVAHFAGEGLATAGLGADCATAERVRANKQVAREQRLRMGGSPENIFTELYASTFPFRNRKISRKLLRFSNDFMPMFHPEICRPDKTAYVCDREDFAR
jgi:hypothetical protein